MFFFLVYFACTSFSLIITACHSLIHSATPKPRARRKNRRRKKDGINKYNLIKHIQMKFNISPESTIRLQFTHNVYSMCECREAASRDYTFVFSLRNCNINIVLCFLCDCEYVVRRTRFIWNQAKWMCLYKWVLTIFLLICHAKSI